MHVSKYLNRSLACGCVRVEILADGSAPGFHRANTLRARLQRQPGYLVTLVRQQLARRQCFRERSG
jgi:hypothetical protein